MNNTEHPASEPHVAAQDQQAVDGKAADRSAPEGASGQEQAEPGKEPAQGPLPKPTFETFLLSLASSVLVQLGEVPDPATGRQEENILAAKHTIDILTMLREKIAHGLTPEEERLFEGLLYELRMKYVVKK